MQPPPPVDFASSETVRRIYAAMPAVFERDIARAKGQIIPPQSNLTLKRERPTDEPELAMKRRDTGESKTSTGMPPPATPALAPKSVPASAQPFAAGVPPGTMPDRTRMVQMRQQPAQFPAQMAQVQQPHVSGVRQMSPPQGTNAGASVGVGQPQGQGQAVAAHSNMVQQVVNSFGQQGLVFMQQLHDPNSAFVKYMVEQIPNFMALPLHQQLKHMQQAQVRLLLACVRPYSGSRDAAIAHNTATSTACGAAATTTTTTAAAATATTTTTTATTTTTTAAAAAAAAAATATTTSATTAVKHG